jgi:hypothetical protein
MKDKVLTLLIGRRLPAALLFPALYLAAGLPAAKAALIPLDLEQLSVSSSRIVCGEVIEVRSYWGRLLDLGEVILTDVRIRVDETWKGAVEKEITVQLLGGRIGERWQYCPESPRFQRGEKVLLFARSWNQKLWTTGWLQGKYRLLETPNGLEVEGKERHPVAAPEPLPLLRERVKTILRLKASQAASASKEAR